jgi:hypothetical protein
MAFIKNGQGVSLGVVPKPEETKPVEQSAEVKSNSGTKGK